MSSTRIETELAAVATRIEKLTAALNKERAWQEELATSLKVLRRLGDMAGPSAGEVMDIVADPEAHGFQVANVVVRKRSRSQLVARAEQALVSMLQDKRNFIRQLDAVNRLREEHRIVVGGGVPGRETSDLSAALGAGKSRYLTVTRREGWALTEWSGVPPVCKDRDARVPTETALAGQDGPTHYSDSTDGDCSDEPAQSDGGAVGN